MRQNNDVQCLLLQDNEDEDAISQVTDERENIVEQLDNHETLLQP